MSTASRAQRVLYARTFGQVLREHRKHRGITQEELALRADFDRTFPSLLERGLRTPTLTVICVIEGVLEVAPGAMVAETVRRVQEAGEGGRAG